MSKRNVAQKAARKRGKPVANMPPMAIVPNNARRQAEIRTAVVLAKDCVWNPAPWSELTQQQKCQSEAILASMFWRPRREFYVRRGITAETVTDNVLDTILDSEEP